MKRTIIIGDIHGCFEELYLLIDREIKPSRRDRLIFVGDYIDRGPDSKGVFDYIMALRAGGYDIITLKGNHEEMMISALDDPLNTLGWMMNGGEMTLKSFRLTSVKEIDMVYIDFIRSMPHYFEGNGFLAVHGGFNDDIADPFSDLIGMLWERRSVYSSEIFKGRTIFHGHTPQPLAALKETLNNRQQVINIDTGCVYRERKGLGVLSAVAIEDYSLYSVAAT